MGLNNVATIKCDILQQAHTQTFEKWGGNFRYFTKGGVNSNFDAKIWGGRGGVGRGYSQTTRKQNMVCLTSDSSKPQTHSSEMLNDLECQSQ